MSCFAHNDGNLPEISLDSVYLDNMFWRSYNDFCFGVLNCECMKIKLQDALQAATLGDSSSQKLELLLDCVEAKLNSQNYYCPPGRLLMISGEINERIGRPDSALGNYNDLLNRCPNSIDTTYAIWRKLYLNAVLADTSHGPVFDSLYAQYLARVNTDICYLDSSSHNTPPPSPPPKRSQFEDIDEQIKNFVNDEVAIKLKDGYPNPFVNLVELQYFVSQRESIRLNMLDLNGKIISNLIDKYVAPGWNTLIINGSGLTPGIYILQLVCKDKAINKIINKTN